MVGFRRCSDGMLDRKEGHASPPHCLHVVCSLYPNVEVFNFTFPLRLCRRQKRVVLLAVRGMESWQQGTF